MVASPLAVRRLAAADAAVYRALMLGIYASDPAAFTATVAERQPLPLAWWTARMARDGRPDDAVFGAWDAGVLVGVVALEREQRPRLAHKADLLSMAVLPGWRGRGVGHQLMRAVLAHAAACDGLRLLRLTVTAGNAAAESLYAGHGFVRFGVEPMAVAHAGGFLDKVHMACTIQP